MILVYVLFSKKHDRIYIGMTNNMDRRIKEHNTGRNRSTKAYIPWIIVHSENYDNRVDARKREKYLKSYRGRLYIRETLIPSFHKLS